MSISHDAAVEALLEREAERCAVLLAGDIKRLTALVTEDLVHIHTNGATDDRQAYLRAVAERMTFLRIERGPLQVRIFGTAAVMTGELNQTIRIKTSGAEVDLRAMATQVWVFGEEGWRVASFQATILN